MQSSSSHAYGLVRLAAAACLAAAIAAPMSARAATVASSLPYGGSPDWTTIVFGGTSMATNGTSSTLTTTNYQGVWFGWSPGSPPAWTPGSNAGGNYLSLEASFSADAADWSAYFHDQTHYAAMLFNPTGCALSDCYGATPQAGVEISFSDGAGGVETRFIALDTTETHTYEFLLKNGQVSYRIDGRAYTDAAHAAGGHILVIGDGSGSTGTGVGSMSISGVGFDNAPSFDVLESTAAPEPAAWAMMIGGFGMAGAILRRRRALAAA